MVMVLCPISSCTVRRSTTLFAERVPLAEDPGSGEEYLKLTLPRAQIHALQALAEGDVASVALRRLVATFAESSVPAQLPVRALPPTVLRPRESSEKTFCDASPKDLRASRRPGMAWALRSGHVR